MLLWQATTILWVNMKKSIGNSKLDKRQKCVFMCLWLHWAAFTLTAVTLWTRDVSILCQPFSLLFYLSVCLSADSHILSHPNELLNVLIHKWLAEKRKIVICKMLDIDFVPYTLLGKTASIYCSMGLAQRVTKSKLK